MLKSEMTCEQQLEESQIQQALSGIWDSKLNNDKNFVESITELIASIQIASKVNL
jgi:hypothetical protein